MRSRCLVLFLLLTSIAFAQAKKPVQTPPPSKPGAATQKAPAPAAAAAQPETALPESTVIITLNGVCATSKPSTPCHTQITKGEFDRLLKLFSPAGIPVTPAMKRQTADRLAQLVTVATAAEKKGLQNTPEGKEMVRISELQTMAGLFARNLQETSKPTDAEIEAYYNANKDKFEQVSVNQLFVPSIKAPGTATSDAAADKTRAEKFRERAVAGEPFDKLEKEAIEGTSYQAPPPVSQTLRKESTPPSRQFVFNLKDGEFSQVVTEPAGSVIYKMISKTAIPLAEVKDNISQRLAQEKFQSEMEAVLKSSKPVLNEAYFGPPAPQPTPGTPVPQPAPTPNQQPQ